VMQPRHMTGLRKLGRENLKVGLNDKPEASFTCLPKLSKRVNVAAFRRNSVNHARPLCGGIVTDMLVEPDEALVFTYRKCDENTLTGARLRRSVAFTDPDAIIEFHGFLTLFYNTGFRVALCKTCSRDPSDPDASHHGNELDE